jgi:hypothetical protein
MDVKRHITSFIEPLPGGSYRVRVRSKAAPYSEVFRTLDAATAASERACAALDAACRDHAIARISERLRSRMAVDPTTGCWLFKGPYTSFGYGKVRVLGRHLVAHRLAYETFVGPIPDGLLVCHHCDTPRCIRPEHLFLGTPRDNMLDMVQKGRNASRRGVDNGRAKLTEAIVVEARRAHAAGEDLAAFAAAHGLPFDALRRAARGVTWKHLP